MTVHKPRDRWKGFVENVGLMVNRPAPLQFAALCYRLTKKRTEFLLITSRDTGRWIIPKGWAIKNKTEAESAAQEAFEEAGAVGPIESKPLGTFDYDKWMPGGFPVECRVQVYAMQVERLEKTYPEVEERKRKWFGKKGAIARVQEPELQEIIASFSSK